MLPRPACRTPLRSVGFSFLVNWVAKRNDVEPRRRATIRRSLIAAPYGQHFAAFDLNPEAREIRVVLNFLEELKGR